MSGEEREKYDGLHLLKTTAEINNIGRKYLNPQGYINTYHKMRMNSAWKLLTVTQDTQANKPPTKPPIQASSPSNVISSW
jgi:hypothetical protein